MLAGSGRGRVLKIATTYTQQPSNARRMVSVVPQNLRLSQQCFSYQERRPSPSQSLHRHCHPQPQQHRQESSRAWGGTLKWIFPSSPSSSPSGEHPRQWSYDARRAQAQSTRTRSDAQRAGQGIQEELKIQEERMRIEEGCVGSGWVSWRGCTIPSNVEVR